MFLGGIGVPCCCVSVCGKSVFVWFLGKFVVFYYVDLVCVCGV